MGLFDKKYCDVCGERIKLLGNRKLTDGNLCKECANKLSPFFSERKQSTVEEIREQLAYRAENEAAVEKFRVSRILGKRKFVFIDSDAGNFMVNGDREYRDNNPDVIPIASVIGISIDTDEHRSEITRKDKDGKSVSYTPPRYEYRYEVNVTIQVNHPYFNEIRLRTDDEIIVNGVGREIPDPSRSLPYREAMELAEEIRTALDPEKLQAAAAAANVSVVCPHCGASTVPDSGGRCEYCGSALKTAAV